MGCLSNGISFAIPYSPSQWVTQHPHPLNHKDGYWMQQESTKKRSLRSPLTIFMAVILMMTVVAGSGLITVTVAAASGDLDGEMVPL